MTVDIAATLDKGGRHLHSADELKVKAAAMALETFTQGDNHRRIHERLQDQELTAPLHDSEKVHVVVLDGVLGIEHELLEGGEPRDCGGAVVVEAHLHGL